MEGITWSKCYWPQAKAKLIDTGEAFKSSAIVSASVSGPDPAGSTGGPTAQGRDPGSLASGRLSGANPQQTGDRRQGGGGGDNSRWSLWVNADTCPHLLPLPSLIRLCSYQERIKQNMIVSQALIK